METQEKIELPGVPLAVYREIGAHLRQLLGVEVELIPQTSSEFDYNQGQVSGLWLSWQSHPDEETREKFKQIIGYYRNRYGFV
ncbi:MAG: hypothetical protein ACKPA8_11200 [Dolichospermum sp.]